MFFCWCCYCCRFAYSICSNHTDLLAVHWTKQGHFHLRVFALAIPSTLNILSSSNHTEYACTSSDLNSTVTSSEFIAKNTTWCRTTSTNPLILLHFFFRALLTILCIPLCILLIHLNKNMGLKGMRIFYFHDLAYITEFIKLFQWITNCYVMSLEANYF